MSTYTSPLPPVMSRENSAEDIHLSTPSQSQFQSQSGRPMGDAADIVAQLSRSLEAGPSRLPIPSTLLQGSTKPKGRKASKSVSGSRPTLIVTPAKRTQSYYTPQVKPSDTLPTPSSIPSSPVLGPNIVKRKTSQPSLVRRYTSREDEGNVNDISNDDFLEPPSPIISTSSIKGKGKEKASDSRARSTSTSIVVPQTQCLTENSTYAFPCHLNPSQVSLTNHQPQYPPSSQAWSGMPLSPPPSDQEQDLYPPKPSTSTTESSSSFIQSAYEVGESLLGWVKPKKQKYDGMSHRRGSDDESEKGLIGSDEDNEGAIGRASIESLQRPGKYWGIWNGASTNDENTETAGNYFTLPPTPPLEEDENRSRFEAALNPNNRTAYIPSLPTPALSAKSLSRDNSKRNKLRKVFRQTEHNNVNDHSHGWLTTLLNTSAGHRGGKTAEVLKELGWTVGILVGTFFVTAGLVLWLIQSMPITTLKHLPQSTTDLQLLSAEIRTYMASSDAGWWHTVGVLTFVGCWKHAWSVPGAVILNILVGSLLDPMPALGLLTIITATGSLGAYMLSRPLAPLIAVIFPKPLALVKAALAPDSIPAPATAQKVPGETITPIQTSSDPSQPAIGGSTEKSTVWRRLLTMRAMGLVPWSGMNVACGVVGVDWKVFWLTTAAGSASWSYVTASVGHILSRLKVPTAAVINSTADSDISGGESLTSLLRDPILISKLVFLSALTLLPVILKKRNNPQTAAVETMENDNIGLGLLSPENSSGSGSGSSMTTTPRSSSSFESFSGRPLVHSQVSMLRLDLNGTPNGFSNDQLQQPMSPLSQSLAKFTPTPRMFDLLSFGRTAIRTGQRGLSGSIRGVNRMIRGSTSAS
ncbi:uncharacterized protein L201_007649 [Kwoniella dendrophila CBS 6074]|uniref:Golgi apparatus membrane protein TVP38 n=1 Tax=Kwoniella dendrophila CBS 6074 TaxID=1295534 RepID=A0AAX4K7A6_9TREE